MLSTIIGGTGTLGTELTKQLLEQHHDIIIFSRGEHAQKAHKRKFNSPKIEYIIGDVRDYDCSSLIRATRDCDYCFHLAALKHVDSCENNPFEAVQTNIMGTVNVCDMIAHHNPCRLIYTTTDKAIDPVNTYGMTKGIAERFIEKSGVDYKIFRWGNVIGSQGSVINIFKEKMLKGEKFDVTDLLSTRYWIDVESVVKLMVDCMIGWRTTPNYIIPDMKAATLSRIMLMTAKILKVDSFNFDSIKLGKGEKTNERLVSLHDYASQESRYLYDSGDGLQYTDAELETILRKYL